MYLIRCTIGNFCLEMKTAFDKNNVLSLFGSFPKKMSKYLENKPKNDIILKAMNFKFTDKLNDLTTWTKVIHSVSK